MVMTWVYVYIHSIPYAYLVYGVYEVSYLGFGVFLLQSFKDSQYSLNLMLQHIASYTG